MLHAQLHGKLSTELWFRSEDMLTNAVFGALRYAGPAHIAAVVNSAQVVRGPFPRLGDATTIEFWPRWRSCEPDAVVEDAATVIAVEAKLDAEFADDDGFGTQLQRQARDVLALAAGTGRQAGLLAVTNDGAVPRHELEYQVLGRHPELPVAWISWCDILAYMHGHAATVLPFADVLALARIIGIQPFRGFACSASATPVDLQGALASRISRIWREFPFRGFEAGAPSEAMATTTAHLQALQVRLRAETRGV